MFLLPGVHFVVGRHYLAKTVPFQHLNLKVAEEMFVLLICDENMQIRLILTTNHFKIFSSETIV
jgi:hypothetical protein